MTVPTGDGRHFEIHEFLTTATGGTLVAGDDADDVRWVEPDELRRLPVTAGLIEHLEHAALIPRADHGSGPRRHRAQRGAEAIG